MSRGVPITAWCAAPSANGAGGVSIPNQQVNRRPLTLALSPQGRGEGTRSTTTVARAAVVAEVAVAIANRDGSATATGRGIGLEAGELLIAVRGRFHRGPSDIQSHGCEHHLRRGQSLGDGHWRLGSLCGHGLAIGCRLGTVVVCLAVPVGGVTIRPMTIAAAVGAGG